MKPVSQLARMRNAPLWHVRPDDSVYDALVLLAEHDVGAIMVMDAGRLVSLFPSATTPERLRCRVSLQKTRA